MYYTRACKLSKYFDILICMCIPCQLLSLYFITYVCIPCQLLSLHFITYNVHSSHGFSHLVLITDIHHHMGNDYFPFILRYYPLYLNININIITYRYRNTSYYVITNRLAEYYIPYTARLHICISSWSQQSSQIKAHRRWRILCRSMVTLRESFFERV